MQTTDFTYSTSAEETKAQALPSITVLAPAYNEEAIVTQNLQILWDYMMGLKNKYDFEILLVNDGSKDRTKELADAFAESHPNVRVIHHPSNKNLGGALRTGFANAKGDYIVVMDLDLSYHQEHIERLVNKAIETDADVVLASPYMKGGKNTKVPFMRLALSKVVNRIMSYSAPNTDIKTFTAMVRAYRRDFIRKVNLKSNTFSINPEIIFKALILRGKIVEIPAHLDWSLQLEAPARVSSIKIFKGILAGLMSSFMFRPYGLFMTFGGLLMLLALYMIGWTFVNVAEIYPAVEILEADGVFYNTKFSKAVAEVFKQRPHAFYVGGICLVVALQFLSLGFLSLQNKRYFDELFHINTSSLEKIQDIEERQD